MKRIIIIFIFFNFSIITKAESKNMSLALSIACTELNEIYCLEQKSLNNKVVCLKNQIEQLTPYCQRVVLENSNPLGDLEAAIANLNK